MKTIEEKRQELLDNVRTAFEKVMVVIDDKFLTNPDYVKYTEARDNLEKGIKKVFRLNTVIAEFFKE